MSYYADPANSPLDPDEVGREANRLIDLATEATRETSIDIELNFPNRYEVEFGVSCDRMVKREWFSSPADIEKRFVELYPEADWENAGWN
jgi:hypothetical protein